MSSLVTKSVLKGLLRHDLQRRLPDLEATCTNELVIFYTESNPKAPLKKLHKHECKICGKRYKYQYGLKKHQYVHTGEKPFECQV